MRRLLKIWIDRWGSWYQRGHNIGQLKSWNLKPGPSNFKIWTQQEYSACKPSTYRHDDAETTISSHHMSNSTKQVGMVGPRWSVPLCPTAGPHVSGIWIWLQVGNQTSLWKRHACACKVRTRGPSENKFSKFHLVLFLPQSRTAELAGYVSDDYIISEEFHWAEPIAMWVIQSSHLSCCRF